MTAEDEKLIGALQRKAFLLDAAPDRQADVTLLRQAATRIRELADDVATTQFERDEFASAKTTWEAACETWKDRCLSSEAERDRLSSRVAELEGALKEAREMVASWGSYAGDYFIEKHGLADDLALIDRSLIQPASEEKANG